MNIRAIVLGVAVAASSLARAEERARSVYSALIAERKADILLTYCTNAIVAVREVDGARMVAIGAPLAVGADYGLTTMKDAARAATRFVEFVLSEKGQAILARHGFAPLAER
jgi:ABC-type molybdate transport system substrate-binding protein